MPTNGEMIKKARKPKVMLVGTFPDLFLEALTELEVDFEVNKTTRPVGDQKVDILVIAPDRTDQVCEYVGKFMAVPVVHQGVKGFYDFNPLKETGNAFLFADNSAWHMLEAFIRANETFKFTYDWKVLKEEVQDFAKYGLVSSS